MNETRTVVINSILPNGTTVSSGTDSPTPK